MSQVETHCPSSPSCHYHNPLVIPAKRLWRHQNKIFTFLDYPEADWNNNFAERQIRLAVILRRNSQCNRSEPGAATQAVLMSPPLANRTLKLRSHDPRATFTQALTTYAATGKLPPNTTAIG